MADSSYETPAGNHGSCIHQNKYPVQDDEYNYHDPLQAPLTEGIGDWARTPLVTCSGVDDFFPRRKTRDRQNGRPWISTLEWKLRLELSGDQDAALTSSSLSYYAVGVSDGIFCSGMVGHTAVQWHFHPQVSSVEVSQVS